jgi:GTP-binding protein
VFDLFAALEANDQQLDFPVMFASGRVGWCDNELDGLRNLDALIRHGPQARPDAQISRREEPFRCWQRPLSPDPFIGRILTGRVESWYAARRRLRRL